MFGYISAEGPEAEIPLVVSNWTINFFCICSVAYWTNFISEKVQPIATQNN